MRTGPGPLLVCWQRRHPAPCGWAPDLASHPEGHYRGPTAHRRSGWAFQGGPHPGLLLHTQEKFTRNPLRPLQGRGSSRGARNERGRSEPFTTGRLGGAEVKPLAGRSAGKPDPPRSLPAEAAAGQPGATRLSFSAPGGAAASGRRASGGRQTKAEVRC